MKARIVWIQVLLLFVSLAHAQSVPPPVMSTSPQSSGNQQTLEVRGWLGVQVRPVPTDVAASIGSQGAQVVQAVDGGPAAQAGVLAGDVIRSFNGKSIAGVPDLLAAAAAVRPGTKVDVVVLRNGSQKILSVRLGEAAPTAMKAANRVVSNAEVPQLFEQGSFFAGSDTGYVTFGTMATKDEICAIFAHPYFLHTEQDIKKYKLDVERTLGPNGEIDFGPLARTWVLDRLPPAKPMFGDISVPDVTRLETNNRIVACLKSIAQKDRKALSGIEAFLGMGLPSASESDCVGQDQYRVERALSPTGEITERRVPVVSYRPGCDLWRGITRQPRDSFLTILTVREGHAPLLKLLDAAEARFQEVARQVAMLDARAEAKNVQNSADAAKKAEAEQREIRDLVRQFPIRSGAWIYSSEIDKLTDAPTFQALGLAQGGQAIYQITVTCRKDGLSMMVATFDNDARTGPRAIDWRLAPRGPFRPIQFRTDSDPVSPGILVQRSYNNAGQVLLLNEAFDSTKIVESRRIVVAEVFLDEQVEVVTNFPQQYRRACRLLVGSEK